MQIDDALAHEWTALQNNAERYEYGALAIKLVAVLLYAAGLAIGLLPWLSAVLVWVLWCQEAIFKTYQFRLGERLLLVEKMLATEAPAPAQAFQLHSGWMEKRQGMAGLVREYVRSACRPTVAFPYAVLCLLALAPIFRG